MAHRGLHAGNPTDRAGKFACRLASHLGGAARGLFLLFDLAAAVDNQAHFFAVFHRRGGYALSGRLYVPDLRITGRLDFGDQLILVQGRGVPCLMS
jgi:hypothetical protein